jgi:hypothetical protein
MGTDSSVSDWKQIVDGILTGLGFMTYVDPDKTSIAESHFKRCQLAARSIADSCKSLKQGNAILNQKAALIYEHTDKYATEPYTQAYHFERMLNNVAEVICDMANAGVLATYREQFIALGNALANSP